MTQQAYPGRNDLTCEEANALFRYEDGDLFWKIRGKSRRIGTPVGSVGSAGYRQVKIKGKLYGVHRLIWIMHGNAPAKFVDHINGNTLDNRIENLRAATHSQNCMNRCQRSDNKSGIKGVYWSESKQKWIASVGLNYKQYRAGAFDTKEEAAAAVVKLREKLHGKFARA